MATTIHSVVRYDISHKDWCFKLEGCEIPEDAIIKALDAVDGMEFPEAKQSIEEMLGCNVRHFSWEFGGKVLPSKVDYNHQYVPWDDRD